MLSPKMMGIVSMVGGIVMVSLQDAMVKLFADSYALHEVMLVRATVALSLTLVILLMSGDFNSFTRRVFPCWCCVA